MSKLKTKITANEDISDVLTNQISLRAELPRSLWQKNDCLVLG